MNYLLSQLPIAMYLLILKALDSFSLAKRKLLLTCFVYGTVCCLAAFFITRVTDVTGLAVPPLEEILKVIAVLFLIMRKKVRFLHEALIYGAASGAGFSSLENIIYLYFQPEMLAGTAVVRGFGCAILHMGCTALAATIFLLLISSRMSFSLSSVLSLIPSVLIHVSYNLSQQCGIADPLVLMLVTVVLFIILFIILFSYGERRIYRWMDHSLCVDIQTLLAIRNGNFSSTKAGMYLIEVKSQFKPECFFDMVCYVQLFLDLKIEKQSYMLLCQTGFEGEAMGKTFEEHLAKKEELAALKKRIGPTGMLVLAPLIA